MARFYRILFAHRRTLIALDYKRGAISFRPQNSRKPFTSRPDSRRGMIASAKFAAGNSGLPERGQAGTIEDGQQTDSPLSELDLRLNAVSTKLYEAYGDLFRQ